MGWYSTLLFELATRWLPLHRQLWEAAPYAMALVSVALISWAAWRVAGRWAAAITGVLLLCAGPQTLTLLFSLNDHSTTWFSLALLAATLILFHAPPAWLRSWRAALVVLVVGIIVGANAASDLLLLAAGVAPLLIAAAASWALRPARATARAWWWMLAVSAVMAVSYWLTHWYAHRETVVTPPSVIHNRFAAAEALSGNFKLWWQSLMVLGDGDFFGLTLGLTSALQLLCGLLTLLAVALVARLTWRESRSALALRGAGPRLPPERAAAARIAWCSFWGSSALLLSASFVFSSNPLDISSSRYLLGVIYAAAALLPLVGGGRLLARAAIVIATCAFAFTGVLSLLENQASNPAAAKAEYALYNQVAKLAASKRLQVGYADYWDAAPLMWDTHFRLRAYPVQDCGGHLCWFYLHMITSWYTPRPRVHTFLLSNTAQPVPAEPIKELGAPSATYQLGTITMYVYPYDIASRMKP
jgi:hypothetical protein